MAATQLINLLTQDKLKLLTIERWNTLVTFGVVAGAATLGALTLILLLLLGGVSAASGSAQGEIREINHQVAELDKLDDGSGAKLEDVAGTLQGQLVIIKGLLDTKAKIRFGKAIERVGAAVPPDISFTQAAIDEKHVMTLSGTARSYGAVGRFAEALKQDGRLFNKPASGPTNYFKNVVVASTSFDQTTRLAQYSLRFELAEETFDASGG